MNIFHCDTHDSDYYSSKWLKNKFQCPLCAMEESESLKTKLEYVNSTLKILEDFFKALSQQTKRR